MSSAVVLICDERYILPTLATAMSAHSNINPTETEIIIYVLGEKKSWSDQFDHRLKTLGIVIEWIQVPGLDDLARFHRDRYLPPITLARLWLGDFLPIHIDRFLYLDGDIMVEGSLEPLLKTLPPVDGLAVAPDNLQLFQVEWGIAVRRDKRYLADLGVSKERYFNAGVIYASRIAWNQVAARARDFLWLSPELCRSSDQSALNHAAMGKVEILSQRYNFQTEHMMISGGNGPIQGVIIYHFTGGPKPWVRAAWPWSEYFNRFYRQAEIVCSEFNLTVGPSPIAQTVAGEKHRLRFRFRQRWIYFWRMSTRRNRLKALMDRQ